MAYYPPNVTDFKQYFNRDFPYGSTTDTVMDSDILKAMNLASINLNEGLFPAQDNFWIGYLLLSAHYLVTNLQNSSQGIAGQYDWLTSSKSAGSVSQGIAIPDRILASPEFSMLTKTRYGALYLDLILPYLSGNFHVVLGDTLP